MAEAMARARGGGRVEAVSAGLTPTGRIAPETLLTLDRLGYPCHGLASKGISAIDLARLDTAVSLIGPAGFGCLPRSLPVERIAWRVQDPYGGDASVYMMVGREIESRVMSLLDDVLDRELPLL